MATQSIRTVDFGGKFSGSCDWTRITKELDEGLSEMGFVYLKNTGISNEKVEQAFKASNAFFNLNSSIKATYEKDFIKKMDVMDGVYPGYTPAGAELEGDAEYEHKESFDICGSMRIYPDDQVPNFREDFTALEDELRNLTLRVAGILGLALGLSDSEYFVKNLTHIQKKEVIGTTTLRALYYPSLNDELAKYESAARCAAHTDYGLFTLLLMDVDAVGLEVKCFDGKWIPANPIPGTILLNIGDLLQLYSDDRYPATIHRVELPAGELMSKTRKSIAYFVNTDDKADVHGLQTKHNMAAGVQRKEVWNTFDYLVHRSNVAYSKIIVKDI